MKKLLLLQLLVCQLYCLHAQPIPPKSIQDSIIGWMKIYHFKGANKPLTVDDKIYSATQLNIADSFANWMQASYTPKGGLGDVKKFVSERLTPYNQFTAGKPQSYGAYANTYFELKFNSTHKLELYTNSHVWWAISANGIPGNWGLQDISTPSQYYWTMPLAETEEEDARVRNQLDISQEENIKPFTSFWVKNMGFGRGKEQVLLCRDNRSPFLILTKGEYLNALETAIPFYYEKQKKIITEANGGNSKNMAIPMNQLNQKIERYKTGLKNNREKYKDQLEEKAMTSYQPGLIDLDAGRDVFTSQYLTDGETKSARYAVYKVDPALAALCKSDKPQWILVSWDYYPGDAMEQQQHEAIIRNFNFRYLYDFFFDPSKVKGQAYKPVHIPERE